MLDDMFSDGPIKFADEISEIEFDLSNRAAGILMDLSALMQILKRREIPVSLMRFLNDVVAMASTVQKLEDARDN